MLDLTFGMGDAVTYGGKEYVIVELSGPVGEPVSAVIEDMKAANRRQVPYHSLKRAEAAISIRQADYIALQRERLERYRRSRIPTIVTLSARNRSIGYCGPAIKSS